MGYSYTLLRLITPNLQLSLYNYLKPNPKVTKMPKYRLFFNVKVARSRLYSCHLEDRPVCDMTRSEYGIKKDSVDGSTLYSHGFWTAICVQRNHAHAKRGHSCTLSPTYCSICPELRSGSNSNKRYFVQYVSNLSLRMMQIVRSLT